MKTYRISSIIAKSGRVKGLYLEACKRLATEWNEDAGTASFDDDAIIEIRAIVSTSGNATPEKHKPCSGCRGL
jgi:hypothetical protein